MHYETVTEPQLITCSVKAAVQLTGLGKHTIYRLMNDKRIESATVGGRRLIFVDTLRAYIESFRDS